MTTVIRILLAVSGLVVFDATTTAAAPEPLIVAHRGLIRYAPENAIANFRACVEPRTCRAGKNIPTVDDALKLVALRKRQADGGPWQSLFNGKSLEGWNAEDLDECFRVQDGAIVAGGGPLARLSYAGPVNKHDFRNFELKLEVLAKPGSNGGVFFHTGPQSKFLKKGYEVQVCNSCGSKGLTGSLFVIEDHDTSPVNDDEWFEYHIIVSGQRIVIKVNGKTTVDYTEPANPKRPDSWEQRVLSHGLIALQAHDPESTVLYRNIRVKVLPD